MKLLHLLIIICISSCSERVKYPIGGYDYPKRVEDKDTNFYFYPIKDLESKKDSFYDAFSYRVFRSFQEPNLSIRSLGKDIFRFVYEGWSHPTVIISLTEKMIIVKKGDLRSVYDFDKRQLNEIEKIHLRFLQKYFPVNELKSAPRAKHYVDSMIEIYPELLNPEYYRAITEKTFIPKNQAFKYSITKISLTKEDFKYLCNLLNNSGYWLLPYKLKCEYPLTDGYGFLLEANTKSKYKVVSATGCLDDTSKFIRACQKLVEYAHLDKEIQLARTGAVKVYNVPLEEIKSVHYKRKQKKIINNAD